MKKIIVLLAFFGMANKITAQNVGIGTTTPNTNAALEIKSNNKGLLMPRLSTIARNSMTNVAKGMLVYDTTRAGFYYHDGGKWLPISQSNIDSLLRYTYPGVAPTISSMPANNITVGVTDFYGTLYDNGGASGNYVNNSNSSYKILTTYDSTLLIKVVVEEMNIESPYDSLEIFTVDDYANKQLLTGNRTGTFYFRGDRDLEFKFRSNGVNNLSGFKINWTKVTSNSQNVEPPPLTGWYFNVAKMAARGGININNNWATDSLGILSFAYGQNSSAKAYNSYVLGSYSQALNTFSTAIGYGLIATNSNQIVMGKYNYIDNAFRHNRVFEIGNGYPLSRSNALTILSDGNTGIGTVFPTTKLDVDGGIRTKYSGSVILSVTGTGSAASVNLTIPALPTGWDFTNTLVLVSVADGVSGIIYSTKLTTATNIQLLFEANATGPTRFNYIVFKL